MNIKLRLKNVFSNELDNIMKSNKSKKEKLKEVEILFDTIKFLDNYKENCKILNIYKRNVEIER